MIWFSLNHNWIETSHCSTRELNGDINSQKFRNVASYKVNQAKPNEHVLSYGSYVLPFFDVILYIMELLYMHVFLFLI